MDGVAEADVAVVVFVVLVATVVVLVLVLAESSDTLQPDSNEGTTPLNEPPGQPVFPAV